MQENDFSNLNKNNFPWKDDFFEYSLYFGKGNNILLLFKAFFIYSFYLFSLFFMCLPF
jgi:hypothetical protein